MIRFRTRNHRLPIEIGNWERTPINERLFQTCNRLGDEFHYLFECTIYDRERKQYLQRYYYNNPSTFKLQKLMSSEKDFINLCTFVKPFCQTFNSYISFTRFLNIYVSPA